ncbi:hypothetical protein A2V71_03850 [Candidatus Berkelbacteria bacterium RBG_13_40_8]|uniref:Prepilin-type N-terminal cleavage/methylation domain-containing protein n=1 Tax=Candidatus Berkelbacteria bacterium RBG_13_40_8 TaxID=1797467 RepID=A0A1F5DLZ7_9BACT|nr:MAG: hypothetical protein A2V71_03850 [Candidatus Berkelbacteria bacterium RBG_13_40_8]
MKKNSNLKNQTACLKAKLGMTIIELVVYLGIVAIVLVTMIDMTTRLVTSQVKSATKSEVQQNLGYAMERISSSIANASVASGTYPSDTLNLTVEGNPVVFKLNDSALEIEEAGLPSTALTSSKVVVSAPSGGQIFTKMTNGEATSIKVNLMVTLANDINVQQQAQTTILMRGK